MQEGWRLELSRQPSGCRSRLCPEDRPSSFVDAQLAVSEALSGDGGGPASQGANSRAGLSALQPLDLLQGDGLDMRACIYGQEYRWLTMSGRQTSFADR